MVRKLRIDRKAHKRRSYLRNGKIIKGSYVDRTVYYAKDRGKPGRGKKIIKIKHPGTLGKDFFKKSEKEQKKILGKIAETKGEKVAGGRMRAIQVLTKRTNPKVSRRAASLAAWVYKNY